LIKYTKKKSVGNSADFSYEQEKNREALNINWFCMGSRTRLATLVKKLQPFDLTIAGRRNTGYRLKRI
ncbi:hypothetical protein, partial [Faecalibaculum rodentium]|uniref:hypothetical protein n=1 Tax=Faecalibaculum rodentium TaxID=1702221 RepID=UPI0025A26ECF